MDCQHAGVGVDQGHWKALAPRVVFNASQHQGAAQAVCIGAHFVDAHPQGALYAGVELCALHRLAQLTAVGKAQVGDVFGGTCLARWTLKARHVDADQGGGREGVGGFFKRLACATDFRRFTGVEVARRVVQAQALWRVFFNQEVAAIALNDGGHGDTGFPTDSHFPIIFRVSPRQCRGVSGVTFR